MQYRVEDRRIEAAEVQSRPVAEYLPIERRFAVGEGHREPEFFV